MPPDDLPDPKVIGIAILGEDKSIIIPPGSPGGLPHFYNIKYSTASIKTKYDSKLAYGLHCKIFNPGYPYIYLSAVMHLESKIELDTRLFSVEDLRNPLIYPEICKKEEWSKFQRKYFQWVNTEFPDQEIKKYFFYKKFLFDYRSPAFYELDPDVELTIYLKLASSNQNPGIDKEFEGKAFKWIPNPLK